jgi:hypothetical protein
MKLVQIVGVVWLFVVAVRVVRLCLGYEHMTQDDIQPMIIGGLCGGLGSWYAGRRRALKAGVK